MQNDIFADIYNLKQHIESEIKSHCIFDKVLIFTKLPSPQNINYRFPYQIIQKDTEFMTLVKT